MFYFGPDVGLGTLPPAEQSPFWCLRQSPSPTWPHGDATLHIPSCHLLSLLQALIPGIPIEHPLFSMQQLGCPGHVLDVGASGGHPMDQDRVFIYPNVGLHAQEPLVPLAGGVDSGSLSRFRFLVEMGTSMMVAPTTVSSRSSRPFPRKCSLTAGKIFSPNWCFSRKSWNARMVAFHLGVLLVDRKAPSG